MPVKIEPAATAISRSALKIADRESSSYKRRSATRDDKSLLAVRFQFTCDVDDPAVHVTFRPRKLLAIDQKTW